MTYEELESVFKNWLYFENEPNELLVAVATVLANRLDSVPIWMFLVGPASSLKSTILVAMDGAKEIHHLSDLTENALMSGYKTPKGGKAGDISLLRDLNKKTLVIKDFTTILSVRPDKRLNILSQFRDAYDGFASKSTGVGEVKAKAKFGFLAGVTNAIESSRQTENVLGERFMYFRNSQGDSDMMCEKAIENAGRSSIMNHELKTAMQNYLNNASTSCEISIEPEIRKTFIRWARKVVKLRSAVTRNSYTREIEIPVVPTEYSARFVIQMITIFSALKDIVNFDRAMRVVKSLVRDAIPTIRLYTLQSIVCGHKSVDQISKFVKVSPITIKRVIEELKYIEVVGEGLFVTEDFQDFFRDINLVSATDRPVKPEPVKSIKLDI